MLEKVEKYILYLTVLLLPVAVLPVFPNPFGVAKVTIVSFGVALILLIRAVRVLEEGKLEIPVGKFDLGVFTLALFYLASALLLTPNKMEAFFLPGTATLVIAGALLYFLANSLDKKGKRNLLITLFLSSVLVSLTSLLAYGGILAKIPQLPAFMKDTLFNTLGGHLPTAIFLTAALPFGVGLLIKEKETPTKLFYGVSILILVIGLGISIYTILPGKATTPRLPDFNTSWSVSVDSLKESPLLGVGPGNYLSAFNRFRPLTYNQTDLWNVRFTSARNLFMTTLTEVGILGFAALVLILFALYKYAKSEKDLFNFKNLRSASVISLLVLILAFVFFSATHVGLIMLFVLLSLTTDTKNINLNLSAQRAESSPIASRLPAILVAVPVIVLLIAFGYFGSRALAAEATFKRSLDALARNDGRLTYDLMRQAISQNPLVDRYHASYAQINLALAQNIAQQEDLTDQDRQTVAQLVQQAIREAKAAVTLNPQRAGNWELLARTYQSIMAFAQGADTFATQSFNQAVALDPVNPNLRIALGGVHYALGNYDEAIRAFELATLTKPDLANAHYNLAAALREKGEIERAINQMTIVLSLVEEGTEDYDIARRELENLEARRTEGELGQGDELSPPLPAEEPVIEPPLELPEDSNPPETQEGQVSGSPSPSPTPSPTPTP